MSKSLRRMNMPAKREKKEKPLICRCVCPYCDVEMLVEEHPFCRICKVSFGRCSSCGAVITIAEAVECPSCGKPLSKGG